MAKKKSKTPPAVVPDPPPPAARPMVVQLSKGWFISLLIAWLPKLRPLFGDGFFKELGERIGRGETQEQVAKWLETQR